MGVWLEDLAALIGANHRTRLGTNGMNCHQLAQRCGEILSGRGEFVATAESCTGGGVAAALTDVSGSSGWFDRGFVTYSNAAKVDCLGVSLPLIEQHGAVSEPVVRAMAKGAIEHSVAHWALATSGIAGPTGGTKEKPVGTVCFAWAGPKGWLDTQVHHFSGDRAAVRQQSVLLALERLLMKLEKVALQQ